MELSPSLRKTRCSPALFASALLLATLGCAQHPAPTPSPAATFLLPMPPPASSTTPLHLNFSVRNSAPEVIGAEIYLNPTRQSHLTSTDKSYVGAVYFSHPDPNSSTQTGAFSVPLPPQSRHPWTERPTLLLLPLWSSTKPTPEQDTPLVIDQAAIRPVDNSAFN